jgi:hypothetical protein
LLTLRLKFRVVVDDLEKHFWRDLAMPASKIILTRQIGSFVKVLDRSVDKC